MSGSTHALYTLHDLSQGRELLSRLERSFPGSVEVAVARVELSNFRTGGTTTIGGARVLGKGGITNAAAAKNLPSEFELHQSYPNPFNPTTTIDFDLPEGSHVILVVYDVLGRKVAELVNSAVGPGFQSVTWDAGRFASGTYFVRFTAADAMGALRFQKVTRILLAK